MSACFVQFPTAYGNIWPSRSRRQEPNSLRRGHRLRETSPENRNDRHDIAHICENGRTSEAVRKEKERRWVNKPINKWLSSIVPPPCRCVQLPLPRLPEHYVSIYHRRRHRHRHRHRHVLLRVLFGCNAATLQFTQWNSSWFCSLRISEGPLYMKFVDICGRYEKGSSSGWRRKLVIVACWGGSSRLSSAEIGKVDTQGWQMFHAQVYNENQGK